MPYAEVNGARLWYEEAGEGPAVVLVHGGLGDSRLWDEQFQALAERFRTVRFDLRFYGRSTGPPAPWSSVDDVRGLLDALAIDGAALVGLSVGGRIAIDAALELPDRVWALVPIASGISGADISGVLTGDEDAEFDDAIATGDLERAMSIDLAVWAPLGVDERIRELWRATPDATGLPAAAEPQGPAAPAAGRLREIAVPTLVVEATHDPPQLRELATRLAREIPHARHVQLESDHYLTLREPGRLNPLLVDFLAAAAPQ